MKSIGYEFFKEGCSSALRLEMGGHRFNCMIRGLEGWRKGKGKNAMGRVLDRDD